jgi:hypothetical protein
MQIRQYQPGDERAQAEIFNQAAAGLPAFKPASPEEVARRYRADPDPAARLYATEGGRVVGYATLSPNGRISYPWCRDGAEAAREPLLEAVLAELRRRGAREAWTTYRSDWRSVLDFFTAHGFRHGRDVLNYAAPVDRLPSTPLPPYVTVTSLLPSEAGAIADLGRGLVQVAGDDLARFYFENAYFAPPAVFALRDGPTILGIGLAIVNPAYADPTKLDAAMPCFRLGAVGTEAERHKRVNGLVSGLWRDEHTAELVLAEAARRLAIAGLVTAAGQVPSDRPELVSVFDRYLKRQGSFPILSRPLN